MSFNYLAAIEQMNANPHVAIFYHRNCADGITSAILTAIDDLIGSYRKPRRQTGEDAASVRANMAAWELERYRFFNSQDAIIDAISANYCFIPYDYAEHELDPTIVNLMSIAKRSYFVDIVPSIGVIERYNQLFNMEDGNDYIVRVYDHHESSIVHLRERYPEDYKEAAKVVSAPSYDDGTPDFSDHAALLETEIFNIDNFLIISPLEMKTLSGAGLVAKKLWAKMRGYPLIESITQLGMMVSDRDTWQFKNEYSKALHYALAHCGYFSPVFKQEDFHSKVYQLFGFTHNTTSKLSSYKMVVEATEESVRNNVDTYSSVMYVTRDYFSGMKAEGAMKVMLCPMAYGNASYAGEYMYTILDADVAITYQDDLDGGIRRFSIRMDKNKPLPYGFDAKAIALHLGGGGHEFAAGVKRPISENFTSWYAAIGNTIRDLITQRNPLPIE